MFDTHLCKCYQLSVMKSYQFLTFCFSLTLTVNVFAFICTALSNMRAIFLQNCLEGKSYGKNTQRANGHHNPNGASNNVFYVGATRKDPSILEHVL